MTTGGQIAVMVLATVAGGVAGFGVSRSSGASSGSAPPAAAVATSQAPDAEIRAQETSPAQVQAVPLSAPNTATGPESVFQYVGATYNPTIPVHMVAKNEWRTHTPEASFTGVYSAYRAQDKEWVKETFADDERALYHERIDSGAITGDDEVLRLSLSASIAERIDLGHFATIVTVVKGSDGEVSSMVTPFVRTDKGWFRTMKLDQHATLAMISAMVAKRYDVAGPGPQK